MSVGLGIGGLWGMSIFGGLSFVLSERQLNLFVACVGN